MFPYLFQLNAKKLNKPIEVSYFLKPIFFQINLMPLTGCIVVFSIYAEDERKFLVRLGEIMGAVVQDSYREVARPLLICPTATAENIDYNEAIKWSKLKLMDVHFEVDGFN